MDLPNFDQYPIGYKGFHFKVRTLPGAKHPMDVIVHPGASAIIPVFDNGDIILIRNERFVVGRTLWEIPCGTLEPKEHPIETAYRELIEETGYKAKIMEPLTTFFTTPGLCNEVMYCYMAKELEFVGQSLDFDEKITIEIMPFEKALKMALDGEILDGKTLAALLFYNLRK